MKAAKNIHSFTKYDHGLQTGMIRIRDLRDFSNHPFKVVKDAAMYELMESIRQEGVLVPLLVRPIRMRTEKGEGAGKHMDEKEACHEENRYEIIAGHRRKTAAEWAGLREVPAIVRDLDDDQAVIAMVDSNLQRDHLLPSEKAYAYKMRLEAMKHQGKRLNLPMAQIEPKEESPSSLCACTAFPLPSGFLGLYHSLSGFMVWKPGHVRTPGIDGYDPENGCRDL